MIGTILIGNTLVDVLAAALASGLRSCSSARSASPTRPVIMTFLIVIFAAVLPKTYALAYSDRVALLVAPIMRAVIVVLNPITVAIEFIVRLLLKLTPTKADDEANILAAHEEIRGTIELQTKEGAVGAPRRRHAGRRARPARSAGRPTSWCIGPRWRRSTPTTRRRRSSTSC